MIRHWNFIVLHLVNGSDKLNSNIAYVLGNCIKPVIFLRHSSGRYPTLSFANSNHPENVLWSCNPQRRGKEDNQMIGKSNGQPGLSDSELAPRARMLEKST